MLEEDFSSERLASMVKTGVVQNYSDRGVRIKGDPKAHEILLKTEASLKLGLTAGGWGVGPEGFTRVGLVPLSSSIVKGKISPEFGKNDVAVFIAYHAEKLSEDGRGGPLMSVVIMSERDAASFVEGIKSSPDLVYKLVRHLNGAPVTRDDGSPADIRPGRAVEILANTAVGGEIRQTIRSAPFEETFKPNPMF